MKAITFLLIFMGSLNLTFGQSSAIDVIKKVNDTYAQSKSFQIITRYDYFANYTTLEVKETKEGILKKDGKQVYNKVGDLERLETKKLKIIANNEEKLLVVQPNQDIEAQSGYIMDMELEKILAQAKDIRLEDKGTYWFISIASAVDEITQINIAVEKNIYFISKVIIYYRNPIKIDEEDNDGLDEIPRLEITYKVDFKPKFSKNDFSENKYIKSRGNKKQPSDDFKDYQFIDYCEKSKDEQNKDVHIE
jgi:hypothetical protein